MIPPSLEGAAAALLHTDPRWPDHGPTDDEEDVALALRAIQDAHKPHPWGVDPDRGVWGLCGDCGARWPCTTWILGQHVAVQYLGRAADRVWARTQLNRP